MPNDVRLVDLRRQMQDLWPRPSTVLMSKETLKDIEDSFRNWELEEARRRDQGHEKGLIACVDDGKYKSWEEKQKAEHAKRKYMAAGDKVYGMTLVVDNSIPYGTFKFEGAQTSGD